MELTIGALVRIRQAPIRPEVEGQNGFVKKIIYDPNRLDLQPVFVVAPVCSPNRPVGCVAIELEDGDIISTMGDLVRIVA